MQIKSSNLPELAQMLTQERKRQKLTRSQTAAVCNVSPSFIRDAETHPERCSMEKMAMLVNGLGMSMTITGSKLQHVQGLINSAITEGQTGQVATAPGGGKRGKGLINSPMQEGGKRNP